VLTDSGGYQVFSLPSARSISEEGATFRSYVDHRTVLLSPESSIETQVAIGGDVMMAFDHCVASTADLATARAAADLTARWAARSLKARGESPQALFGIVQGALFPDLRRECAARLAEMPFDGYAIGGLAVGESRAEREDVCALTTEHMPQDKPRYLMGVGTPLDILEAVHRGVDMFDCIIPTQVAQRGGAFTSQRSALGSIIQHRGPLGSRGGPASRPQTFLRMRSNTASWVSSCASMMPASANRDIARIAVSQRMPRWRPMSARVIGSATTVRE